MESFSSLRDPEAEVLAVDEAAIEFMMYRVTSEWVIWLRAMSRLMAESQVRKWVCSPKMSWREKKRKRNV